MLTGAIGDQVRIPNAKMRLMSFWTRNVNALLPKVLSLSQFSKETAGQRSNLASRMTCATGAQASIPNAIGNKNFSRRTKTNFLDACARPMVLKMSQFVKMGRGRRLANASPMTSATGVQTSCLNVNKKSTSSYITN